MDTWVNNLETLIGQSEELVVQTWLKSWFYSKWVNICWILWISHVSEAWKEVWLSGDTGYSEIPASRDSYFRCDGYLGPEFRPGNIAMSSVWCSYRFKWIEHLLKFYLVLCSWVMLEAQDLWSHLNAFDDNLIKAWLIVTASWTTTQIPEVNWQLMKTVWSSSYAYNPSFIISGGNTCWS